MLKNIKYYFAALVLMVGPTSCLEKLPGSSIPEGEAMQTFSDAEQVVTGIYAGLKSSALFSGSLTVMPDIQADLVYAVENFTNVYGSVWQWDILSTDSDVESVYAALYTIIARCNFYLDSIDEVMANELDVTNLGYLETYTGEVYTIRALCYSKLLECFCKAYDPATAENELGVVLRTKYSEPEPMKRASGDYAYNDVLLPWQWHIINRGYRDNFVIGETDGKTVEEVQAKYKAGADVNCEKAWERTTGDPSIVVAVLDEGIYWRHPDLVNNMWENEDEPYYSDAAGEHVSYEDRDGNGYAGDHFGYDSINNTGVISCDASADTGHGTHVAGVIAARNNNGIGIASIAGGTEDAPGVKVRPKAAMYMSSCRIATAIPSRYTRISTVSGRAASRGRTASIRTMLWVPSYAACMTTRTATGRAAMSSATCTRTA